MARVVLLQRIVPSYRLEVLRRLAEELGWQIVFGRNVPGSIGAAADAPAHPYRPKVGRAPVPQWRAAPCDHPRIPRIQPDIRGP